MWSDNKPPAPSTNACRLYRCAFARIKGVSDYAHKKGEQSDRLAARENAAWFLFTLLDKLARG
ncbi:MAG: hypothetical protein ACREXS_15030 [Gammaproteobacteria bacterium]